MLLVVVGHLCEFFGFYDYGPFHLGGYLGALGVLIFFVHTCYVLMLSLERQASFSTRRLYLAFLIRRTFRIYPLSTLAIGLVAFFHLPQATILGQRFRAWPFDGADVLSNLFLVESFSYRVPILGPTWSLGYEMQMYLFLPLIYFAVRGSAPLWRCLAIYVVAVISCIVILRHSFTPNLALYFPCFFPGVIAYKLREFLKPGRRRIPAWLWPVAILVGAAVCVTLPTSRTRAWVSCLLLGCAIPLFAEISEKWTVLVSKCIAKYSYGIYLSHFFAIWFSFERLHAFPFWARVGVFLLLAAGIPVLAYHLLEDPLIRFGKRVSELYQMQARGTISPAMAHGESCD